MVVMLLAVTAAVLSNTQFRLAGNLQFENIAFNLAEGAIAAAENWLSTGTNAKNGGFTTYSTRRRRSSIRSATCGHASTR